MAGLIESFKNDVQCGLIRGADYGCRLRIGGVFLCLEGFRRLGRCSLTPLGMRRRGWVLKGARWDIG